MQETRFPVEIIIHDDASDDGTADIVREYQAKYPHIIKAICQTKNQFSQDIDPNLIALRESSGKFIALCHGDDYWIDKSKIEAQARLMMKYKIGISGHPAYVIDGQGRRTGKVAGFRPGRENELFSYNRLLFNNANMLPYASIMIDRDAKEEILKIPSIYQLHTVIQMAGAMRDGLLVLASAMAVYRKGHSGTTTSLFLGDEKKIAKTTRRRLAAIRYLEGISKQRSRLGYSYLVAKQFRALSKGEGRYRTLKKHFAWGGYTDIALRLLFILLIELIIPFYEIALAFRRFFRNKINKL